LENPLFIACQSGHAAVVRLLLQYGTKLKSLEDDEAEFQVAANAVLGHWDSGTP